MGESFLEFVVCFEVSSGSRGFFLWYFVLEVSFFYEGKALMLVVEENGGCFLFLRVVEIILVSMLDSE